MIASLLLVLLGTVPGTMMLLAAAPASAAATAEHHHGAPSSPSRHNLPDDCCSLYCSAGCLVCAEITPAEPLAFRRHQAVREVADAAQDRQIAYTSFSHRLPPPIGPPV
jgi:hypothetical protein